MGKQRVSEMVEREGSEGEAGRKRTVQAVEALTKVRRDGVVH